MIAFEAPAESVVDLREYSDILRRGKWLIASFLIGGLVVSGLVTEALSKTYTSQTSVLVKPVVANPFQQTLQPGQLVNLDTETQIATSTVVANVAKQQLKDPRTVATLQGDLKIGVPPNSQILLFSFVDSSPAAAQRGSQAFANAYLAFKRSDAQAEADNITAGLETQIANLDTQLVNVSGSLAATAVNSPDRANDQAQQNILTGELASLNTEVSTLHSLAVQPGVVVASATLPTKATSPKLSINLAIGGAVGLLLGLILAFVLARRDHRIRRADELERRYGLPVLGAIPMEKGGARGLTIERAPGGAAARNYRRLLAAIRGSDRGQLRSLLLVAAAGGPVASSEVAANLAVAAAQSGVPTAWISATYGEDSKLSDELAGHQTLPSLLDGGAVTEDGGPRPGLKVIAPGESYDPAKLVGGGRLAGLLQRLRPRYELTVADMATLDRSADAALTAMAFDGVLLVVAAGRTTREELTEARSELEQSGARLIGAVLVGAKRNDDMARRRMVQPVMAGGGVPTAGSNGASGDVPEPHRLDRV